MELDFDDYFFRVLVFRARMLGEEKGFFLFEFLKAAAAVIEKKVYKLLIHFSIMQIFSLN